jgi:hypothetical protein
MGYQLWTSPITGYRRRGTRLSELRSLIDSGITIRAILEPLQSAAADASSTEIAHVLRARDFDVAGVQAEIDGPVLGFVERAALVGGTVREHITPLLAEHLMSDASPLSMAFATLKGRPRVFVLEGAHVKGIATRTDLNKPPVRIYLFGLVSLLEMHLAFWIGAEYPNDSWQEQLSAGRLAIAKKVLDERHAAGQASKLLDCLQMGDKRDLLLTRPVLCHDLGLASKTEAKRFLKRAEALRNLLAHGQHNLIEGSSWEELFALVEWLEGFVRTSDDQVEQRAAAAAQQGLGELWSSA